MVHYIRFLKPPKLHKESGSRATVKTLITVTTDLGDDFFPSNLDLTAVLVQSDDRVCESSGCCKVIWKGGARVLWVEVAAERISSESRLRVTVAEPGGGEQCFDSISSHHLPLVIGNSSEIWDPSQGQACCTRSERSLLL